MAPATSTVETVSTAQVTVAAESTAAAESAGALEQTIREEIAAGENPHRPIRRLLRRTRAWLAAHPRLEHGYRLAVGLFGVLVVLGGLVLVPLPGPGWLVVFLGLAILGTEFRWARRTTAWLKRTLDRFWQWWRARREARRRARA